MRWIKGIATFLGKFLPPAAILEKLVYYLVALKAKGLPGKEAAAFLMRLDRRLYGLHGQAAVAYGQGVHTKHRHTNYHDFFVKNIRPGEKVLDVGCGSGEVAYDVATRAEAQVLGIDLNREAIGKAQEVRPHPNVEFLYGDALEDIPDAQFDVVILSNVLEHIECRPELLRDLVAVAHPNRLLIRVPLFERDWRVPLKRELGIDYRLDATHFIEYTQEIFVDEITAAGLAVAHLESRWGEIWSVLEPVEGGATPSAKIG